jgi:hypothetical protein
MGFQDYLVLLDGDAHPGVVHRQMQEEGLIAPDGTKAPFLGAFHLDHHLPLLSELDGIAYQIDEDPAHTGGISHHAVEDLAVHLAAHRQPLLMRPHGSQLQHALEGLAQGKGEGMEGEFRGLDLEESMMSLSSRSIASADPLAVVR